MQYINKIRITLVLAAALMLLLYPAFSSYIVEPPIITYVGIVVLTLLAAFTTLRGWVLLALDALVAGCGLIAFEFYAVESFNAQSPFMYSTINQIIALIFLAALYFSIRGLVIAWYLIGDGQEA